MNDISSMLKSVLRGCGCPVPGGGTYGWRRSYQFGQKAKVLVVRNGWFSYRWSQVFEATTDADDIGVIKARQIGNDSNRRFVPLS